jgi:ketopantoate reductase
VKIAVYGAGAVGGLIAVMAGIAGALAAIFQAALQLRDRVNGLSQIRDIPGTFSEHIAAHHFSVFKGFALR